MPNWHAGRTFTGATLNECFARADTSGVSISSVAASLPETIKSPADALAFIAAKKGMDAQKSEAAALLSLLDPNLGSKLNVSA